jgi:NADH dehydrogenase
MSDRLAVTGASGFIGRALTASAATQRWELAGVVRSEAGEAIVRAAGGRPYRLAALEAAALAAPLAGARAVVHLAAIGSGGIDAAVHGAREVAAAARAAGVPRVIHLSGLGVAHYGVRRRCTNAYFLAKLAAEVELYRADLEIVCLRPSFVLAAGSALLTDLLRQMAAGEVERVGDGAHRLQPIALKDVIELVLRLVERPPGPTRVIDVVGPEAVSYATFIDRTAAVARRRHRPADFRLREVPIEDAERRAAVGGYRGMDTDDLDVLLCDEIADERGVEAALGRFLTPLDESLDAAVRATRLDARA